MFFYSILLLSSTTLVLFSQYTGRKLCINLCVMITLMLGAVASLRGLVGTDTFSYHLQFELIKYLQVFDKNTLRIEPAFVAIAKLVELFGGDDPFAYVSLIGILQTLLLIFILMRLESPALFLICYITTFYINFHFNIIREATSLLLIMISFTWMKEGGWKFYIPLLSSVFFHYASILFVPYVLLYKQFKDRKYGSLILIIPIILAFLFGMMTMLSDVFLDKYEGYANDNLGAKFVSGIGFLLTLTLYVGLGITLLKRSTLDVIFFVLPVILMSILNVYFPLLIRIEMFFKISLFLLLTKDVLMDRERQITSVIILALSVLNVYGTLNNVSKEDQNNDLEHRLSPYIPYHTLFNENSISY